VLFKTCSIFTTRCCIFATYQ